MSSTGSTEKTPPKSGEREGGGLLPAVLAGAGLLVVAGLLVFGPARGGAEEEDEKAPGKGKNKVASAEGDERASPKGGVGARHADEATDSRPKPRVNPRIERAIPFGSMAEQSAPGEREVPTFADKAEEITYWEKELDNANDLLEIRKRAIDRMAKIRSQIESGAHETADREATLEDFERRKGIVEKNLSAAEKEVAEIEGKLAELRG